MERQVLAQATPRRVSRRAFLHFSGLAGLAAVLAACAQPTPTPAPTPTMSAATPAGQAPATQPPALPTAVATPADPTPRLQRVDILAGTTVAPPTPRDSNLYWQEIEKRLGCRINFNLVPSAEYNAKLGAVLASGDIPDVIGGSPSNVLIRRAILEGAFMKLQDLGLPDETRGYPGLKSLPDYTWRNSSFNGVIWGLPAEQQRYSYATFLRKDWLDKLGLPVPTTVKDFKVVLEAFAKRDPDANGKADTIGFSICKDRTGTSGGGWYAFTEPFGVPNKWRLERDGKLLHMDVSPEMKAAILYMRELYSAGVFNPDFPTLGRVESSNEFSSGRAGGLNHNLASGYDLLGADLRKVIPTAVVYPITPPQADGYRIATRFGPGFGGYANIHAKYAKDPELAWELLRVLDFWLDPATYDFVNFGLEGIHHTKRPDGSLAQTERGTADIAGIRFWSLRHGLKYVDAPYVTPATREQIKKDTERLSAFGIEDPTWGVYPELGADDPSAKLSELADTLFPRIVRGQEKPEAFDAFVSDWYKQGGTLLTEEWTRMYHKAKG